MNHYRNPDLVTKPRQVETFGKGKLEPCLEVHLYVPVLVPEPGEGRKMNVLHLPLLLTQNGSSKYFMCTFTNLCTKMSKIFLLPVEDDLSEAESKLLLHTVWYCSNSPTVLCFGSIFIYCLYRRWIRIYVF